MPHMKKCSESSSYIRLFVQASNKNIRRQLAVKLHYIWTETCIQCNAKKNSPRLCQHCCKTHTTYFAPNKYILPGEYSIRCHRAHSGFQVVERHGFLGNHLHVTQPLEAFLNTPATVTP